MKEQKMAEDTPLIKQFFEVKAKNPEAVLLYRVGDFYETYSDDALLASKVLGIVLTKRSNGDKGTLPMAGFPHHAIDTYLPRLVRAGYKVAVCDQLEDPKLTKKLVQRGITELVTPGVAFSDQMLECKENNYLAGVCFGKDGMGAAFLDVSTGSFRLTQGGKEFISTLFSSLNPREMVVQRGCEKMAREAFGDSAYVSNLEEWAFVYDSCAETLRRQLQVDSLKGYAVDSCPLGICAAGALLVYLEQTHHGGLSNICSISRIDQGRFVWMDRFTFRNLEVFHSNAGAEGSALVDVMDRCSSPMGSRMLRNWLSMPSMDLEELASRYDVVSHFISHTDGLEQVSGRIGNIGDLERILSRAATGRIAPRELLQLERGLRNAGPLSEYCRGCEEEALRAMGEPIKGSPEMMEDI